MSRKRKKDDSEIDTITPEVGIIFDENLNLEINKIPILSLRGAMTHSLIDAYGLTRSMKLYKSLPATIEELLNFHSSDYVEYLQSINSFYTPDDDVDLEYGLGYDCPPLDGIFDFVKSIAGGTLTATRALINGEVDVAINWNGGWHHAHRCEASGFCYVNDIVLAILEMRTHYDNILYVDLDIHHGDGVEESFEYFDRVLTWSMHKCVPGFFPGSGVLPDLCPRKGKTNVNVPLKDGISDAKYCDIFDRVFGMILNVFTPDSVVIQCGADGLSGDPLGGFNLTPKSLAHCVLSLVHIGKPTLILGGGGYNVVNTAKCWTFITSQILCIELDEDIPDHKYFLKYGPGYDLELTANNRKDENTPESISLILETIKKDLNCF